MANKIKKIIDCKLNEHGQVLYCVKWRETWEPAEKLEPLYQGAVEEFWENINVWRNAKDGIATPARKRKRLEDERPITPTYQPPPLQAPLVSTQPLTHGSSIPEPHAPSQSTIFQPGPFFNMQPPVTPPSAKRGRGRGRGGRGQGRGSPVIKKEVFPPMQQQNVPGGYPIYSPGNVNDAFSFDPKNAPHLISNGAQQQQLPLQDIKPTILPSGQIVPPPGSPMYHNNQSQMAVSPRGRGRGRGRGRSRSTSSTPVKEELFKSEPIIGNELNELIAKAENYPAGVTKEDIKILERWQNPYVKLIVACRVCSKEQKSINANVWKMHFLTHSERKPYNCDLCNKGFVQQTAFKTHMKNNHPESTAY